MDFWAWLAQPQGLIIGDPAAYRPGGSSFNKAEIAHALRTAINNLAGASDPTAALQFYTKLKEAGGLVASDDPRVWANGQGGDIEHLINMASDRLAAQTAPPGGDHTGLPYNGQKLNNIPGKPEVWKVGNRTVLVYMVPGTENDPVYMTWDAPSQEDVQSWFGPGKAIIYNRVLTEGQYRQMGALSFGTTDEIPPGADNPFAGWVNTLATERISQPWIMDADYQRLMAMALVEGRSLTDAEIQSTNWWRTHNAAERKWMITFHGDPETAAQQVADRKLDIKERLRAAGGGQAISDTVINYMATESIQGRWSDIYLNSQITALTDRASGIAIDHGLAQLDLSTVDQTAQGTDRVRDLLATWLGPAFGNWSQAEIDRQAGLLRNDPDAEIAFIEQLKDQRMALLPEYTDRNVSYSAIANTWKQWWLGQWGELPDEKSDLWMGVIKDNDLTEAGKTLRREGLARGNAKVTQDLAGAFAGSSSRERNPILNG